MKRALLILTTVAASTGFAQYAEITSGDFQLDFNEVAIVEESGAGTDTLMIVNPDTFTADRTLWIDVNDANRTITLTGSPTMGDWFDQSVKSNTSPTWDAVYVDADPFDGGWYQNTTVPTRGDLYDKIVSLPCYGYNLNQDVETTDDVTFASVTVSGEVYGSGWDSDNTVPTKNDVYDKIQTLSGGSCEAAPCSANRNVETISADETLTGADKGWQYLDPSGGDADHTVTLPAASAADFFYVFHDGSSGIIRYGSSIVLLTKGQFFVAISDGTDWHVETNVKTEFENWTIEDVTASESLILFKTKVATKLVDWVVEPNTGSVTWSIKYASTWAGASSGTTAVSSGDGGSGTGYPKATIPANNYVVLVTTAESADDLYIRLGLVR